ncbi:MAG TPA: Flp pilus assembly protein CpaB [Acetobacteraceae bacterium]|nr:Flp pilus assembly protein CpaB [Acetobacteraceae bacterium]
MSSTLRFSVIAVLLTAAAALGMTIFSAMSPHRTSAPAAIAAPPAPAPPYLVAAHTLAAGTLARDEDFVAKTAPNGVSLPDTIADTREARASLRGSLIRNYIEAGTPVTVADVLRPRDRGFIASVLREGYRAVAVGVDPVTGVGGLIWPGDHVDLLLTQTIGDSQPLAERALAETVITDVRVIAIDQDMVQAAAGASVSPGKLVRTVTLEVDPLQAQKIAVAATMGKLSLSIRSAAGTAPTPETAPTFGADVSPALQQPVGAKVTVYNGGEGKEVTFK